MVKLPHPPDPGSLRRLGLASGDVVQVDPTIRLWRIHRTTGTHVLSWNELRHYGPLPGRRFEPHDPPPHEQVKAVLYLALDVVTCLAEVFQHTRLVDRHAGTPYLTAMQLTRTVRLLNLAGSWPTRAGASQNINSGPRPRASAWARTIRAAFDDLDGLWYPSSMNSGKPCIALFDTATDVMPDRPVLSTPLAHPDLADPIAAAVAPLGYRVL